MNNETPSNLFPQYADIIRSGKAHWSPSLDSRFRIAQEGDLEVFYAPFDYVASRARIVLVGITPGLVQAKNAFAEAARQLRSGADIETAMREAKTAASFSGPMRSNLVRLLDYMRIADWLGINTTAELFGQAQHLVHYTSVLRYPVFLRGKNYNGSPRIERSRLLTEQVERWFATEIEQLPDAIYVPLGPVPTAVMNNQVRKGRLADERVLSGLPHPSGANAERIAYFMGNKAAADCSSKCNPTKLDAAREELARKIDRLGR